MFRQSIPSVTARSSACVCEVAWFSDFCGENTEFLSVRDPARATFAHCRNMARAAERLGSDNRLLPTSYTSGQEVVPFAAGIAPDLRRMGLLTAIRCGEMHPPMLARTLATFDHLLAGRLTINIINSDLPGYRKEAALRYQRCAETIQIVWSGYGFTINDPFSRHIVT